MKKKKTSQIILAEIVPVGRTHELRDWLTGKMYGRGTMRAMSNRAEKLWPGHVRQRNGSPDKYLILERE